MTDCAKRQNTKSGKILKCEMQRHHDIRLNGTRHSDIQNHKGNATLSISPLMTLSIVRLSITTPSAVCRLCLMPFMLSVGILSAIPILPHLLSVVAPTSVPILFYFENRNFNLGCLESGKWQEVGLLVIFYC
jgi:hypothetical protein